MNEPRASIFSVEQKDQLKRLKAALPFRIVWGAVNPQNGEFVMGADFDRRKLNNKLRKGWLVATIG